MDSLGQRVGAYQRIDTVINNQSYSYYLYSPGETAAIYNVTFSSVGDSKGDYTKESLGNYKFAGINQGSYAPIVYLALPDLKPNWKFNY